MADNDQSQEKSHEPTQKRLEKAKEDGEILTSKEMFVFGTSLMSLIVIFSLGMFSQGMLSGSGSLFDGDHAENLEVLRTYNAEIAFNIFLVAAALFAFPIFAAVHVIILQLEFSRVQITKSQSLFAHSSLHSSSVMRF